MGIAFKTYEKCPVDQRPVGIPLSTPWMMTDIENADISYYKSTGWIIMTNEEYTDYTLNLASILSAWETARLQLGIEGVVSAATKFGQDIMVSFAAENVLLGITQENKTGEVLNKLTGVLAAVQAGSLYEVISRIKLIPVEDYDVKYITEARLITFCNKIETYLGIPLTTEI
jgi:hypothetical protein